MNHTVILIGLFICHFLADFTHLSTSWMLNAKKLGTPLFPIMIHALVHATLMFTFIWFYHSYMLNNFSGIMIEEFNLFITQFTTHFTIDVWKGYMNKYFPSLQNQANKWHWIVFGFDQLLHAIVIIIISTY